MKRTLAGYKIAESLDKIIREDEYSHWGKVVEIVSVIHHQAVTLHRIDEMACNGHPVHQYTDYANPYIYHQTKDESDEEFQKRANATISRLQDKFDLMLEKRDTQLTNRINTLVAELNTHLICEVKAVFGGDPRGATVQLLLPEDMRHYANNWNRDGIYIF